MPASGYWPSLKKLTKSAPFSRVIIPLPHVPQPTFQPLNSNPGFVGVGRMIDSVSNVYVLGVSSGIVPPSNTYVISNVIGTHAVLSAFGS